MTEWEYTRVEFAKILTGEFRIYRDARIARRGANQKDVTKYLNELGKNGWELTTKGNQVAIFKRPVCKIPETFKIPLDGKFIMVCTGMTHEDAVHAMNVIRIVRESSQQFGIISLPVGASFKLVEIEDTENGKKNNS